MLSLILFSSIVVWLFFFFLFVLVLVFILVFVFVLVFVLVFLFVFLFVFLLSKYKSLPMEAFDCPDEPPADYPKGYPAMDVIEHWNPDDADRVPDKHYLSTCR